MIRHRLFSGESVGAETAVRPVRDTRVYSRAVSGDKPLTATWVPLGVFCPAKAGKNSRAAAEPFVKVAPPSTLKGPGAKTEPTLANRSGRPSGRGGKVRERTVAGPLRTSMVSRANQDRAESGRAEAYETVPKVADTTRGKGEAFRVKTAEPPGTGRLNVESGGNRLKSGSGVGPLQAPWVSLPGIFQSQATVESLVGAIAVLLGSENIATPGGKKSKPSQSEYRILLTILEPPERKLSPLKKAINFLVPPCARLFFTGGFAK